MTPDELEELIDGFGDACFDCGEWLEDDSDLTPYETVFAAQQAARQALVQEVEHLQAQLAAANEHEVALEADVEKGDETETRLRGQLEQAKSQQVHCAACGGVECHRLAEIVQLTGMESDQHLVEWVEQAKVELADAQKSGQQAAEAYQSAGEELFKLDKEFEMAKASMIPERLRIARLMAEVEQAKERILFVERELAAAIVARDLNHEQWKLVNKEWGQAKERFESHTKAVGTFLSEMRAIMIDPLEDGEIKVVETCAQLLDAAKRDREEAHQAKERERQLQSMFTNLGAQILDLEAANARLLEALIGLLQHMGRTVDENEQPNGVLIEGVHISSMRFYAAVTQAIEAEAALTVPPAKEKS